MKTIPGGVTLDKRGRPTDANGNQLDGLPDHLSDEEAEALEDVGIVAQKQLTFHDVATLTSRFGLDEDLARKAKGEKGLFGSEQSEVNATEAAAELADEAGLDLSSIDGSGKNGKVTKPDVEAAIKDASE